MTIYCRTSSIVNTISDFGALTHTGARNRPLDPIAAYMAHPYKRTETHGIFLPLRHGPKYEPPLVHTLPLKSTNEYGKTFKIVFTIELFLK